MATTAYVKVIRDGANRRVCPYRDRVIALMFRYAVCVALVQTAGAKLEWGLRRVELHGQAESQGGAVCRVAL
jgi:hypothetical protein